ncbi:S1 family peptidase [Micromonospora sp. NBC_01813]|uniref:S1 family peptidase n=1 Tax=Micromonospora sp. NBC_01813 TaxID=2975988 RepID=UPI002DDB0DE7|nr:S1 family peptidase [Micromonospora sp. NBC_01813]WSA10516.1 S1 family peptidase [Micromonospora sp. NBC_01813]
MTVTSLSIRQASVAFAAGAVLVGGLLASPAAAAPRPTQDLTGEAALTLVDRLGDRSAGAYQDQTTGDLVVTVTDEVSARAVRSAGGVARIVERGAADLDRVTTALSRSAAVTGTSWYADPVTNQVVVSVDSTVTGTRLALVDAVAARFGDAVRVEHLPGVLEATAAGGDPIYSGGSRCSLGFNVADAANRPMFLTAGHCTNNRVFWTIDGVANAGTTVASSFPGNDYGMVRWDNPNANRPGAVNMYNGSTRDISSAANPYVGQALGSSGSTTGLTRGSVTALNVTANYSAGPVTGLFRTNLCIDRGDSGGAVFAHNTALGLNSGAVIGGCVGYHQPVVEVLSAYNARVY